MIGTVWYYANKKKKKRNLYLQIFMKLIIALSSPACGRNDFCNKRLVFRFCHTFWGLHALQVGQSSVWNHVTSSSKFNFMLVTIHYSSSNLLGPHFGSISETSFHDHQIVVTKNKCFRLPTSSPLLSCWVHHFITVQRTYCIGHLLPNPYTHSEFIYSLY